jgi:hypothetical protein
MQCGGGQKAPPLQSGSNIWIRDNGFFVRIDAVIRTGFGFDLVVTKATTEYRPKNEYTLAASSGISSGQTRYSFECQGGVWILKDKKMLWTS